MTPSDLSMPQFLARVHLTPADAAYIAGAVMERHEAAALRGEIYGWLDFLRNALIEEAAR